MIFKALLFSILIFLLKSVITRNTTERVSSLIGLLVTLLAAITFQGKDTELHILYPIVLSMSTIAFLYFYRINKIEHKKNKEVV